jgi:hypothetical protein
MAMRELHKTILEEEAHELEGSLILAGIDVRVFCQDAHAKQLVYVVAVQPGVFKQARAVRYRMFSKKSGPVARG